MSALNFFQEEEEEKKETTESYQFTLKNLILKISSNTLSVSGFLDSSNIQLEIDNKSSGISFTSIESEMVTINGFISYPKDFANPDQHIFGQIAGLLVSRPNRCWIKDTLSLKTYFPSLFIREDDPLRANLLIVGCKEFSLFFNHKGEYVKFEELKESF